MNDNKTHSIESDWIKKKQSTNNRIPIDVDERKSNGKGQ